MNGLRHPAGIATGKLDHMGVDSVPFRPELRLIGTPHELVRRHHLRHDETSSQALCDPPKCHIRHAGERRKDGDSPGTDRADAESLFAYFLISFHSAQ